MMEQTSERLQWQALEGAASAFPARYVRFGAFQIDLKREELCRDGQRTKIQAKVYQTLLMLLARAGEIVTREEVRQRLWPGQFQESGDASVNTAMNKLRQVLDDSPENPAYIETIPRRGYCFLATVEFSDSTEPSVQEAGTAGDRMKPGVHGEQPLRFPWLASMLTPLHATSLVLAGMVIGALLVLAWFSVSSKNHKLGSTSNQESSDAATRVKELSR